MRSCPLINNNPIQDYGPHASTALTFLDYEPPNIPFASLRNPPRILFGPKHMGLMTVLSTLRYCYRWWQENMDRVPVAADYCWGCNEFHGQVTGQSDDDQFDWNAATRFQVCQNCRVARFCCTRCLKTHCKLWCGMNAQLIGNSLRQELKRKRVNIYKLCVGPLLGLSTASKTYWLLNAP